MTMIELLVVIGIIALLAAMAFVGLRFTFKNANEDQTKAILRDLNAMVAEAELAKPMPDLLGQPTLNTRPDLASTGATYIPQYFQVSIANHGVQSDAPYLTGTITTQAVTYSTVQVVPTTYSNDPVQYTAYALAQLATVPKNRELLAKMPANRFKQVSVPNGSVTYEQQNGGTYTQATWPPASTPAGTQYSVPLDAWGHDIFFVPGGGLINSNVATFPIVNPPNPPAGLWSSVTTGTGTYSVGPTPVAAPTGKAFWVSRGPDGDLLMSDDNIYSFNP